MKKLTITLLLAGVFATPPAIEKVFAQTAPDFAGTLPAPDLDRTRPAEDLDIGGPKEDFSREERKRQIEQRQAEAEERREAIENGNFGTRTSPNPGIAVPDATQQALQETIQQAREAQQNQNDDQTAATRKVLEDTIQQAREQNLDR